MKIIKPNTVISMLCIAFFYAVFCVLTVLHHETYEDMGYWHVLIMVPLYGFFVWGLYKFLYREYSVILIDHMLTAGRIEYHTSRKSAPTIIRVSFEEDADI